MTTLPVQTSKMAGYTATTKTWTAAFTILAISVSVANGQNVPPPNGISGLISNMMQQAMLHPNSTTGRALGGLQQLVQRPAVNDVVERVAELLSGGLDEYIEHHNYTIGPKCLEHIEMTLGALMKRERWALRMIDAMGKPASDLLELHLTWLGSYDECIDTNAVIYADPSTKSNPSVPFKGRYCKAVYGITADPSGVFGLRLTVGLCVPNSCDASDTASLANILLGLVPVNTSTLPDPTATCQLESLEYSTKAIVVTTVAAVFIAIIIAGTIYDVVISHLLIGNKVEPQREYNMTSGNIVNTKTADTAVCITLTKLDEKGVMQNGANQNGSVSKEKADIYATVDKCDKAEKATHYKPGLGGKLLISFSLYTNLGKIFNTRQPSGTLRSVHGIRFISMTWVILGHTFTSGLAVYQQHIVLFMPELYRRLTFQAVGNATFSVDTFFTLSGLLVAYLSLKELKKVGGIRKFKWVMFYFHRYWRLTPPYMLVLMVYVPTIMYWSDGPLWPQTSGDDECKGTWWWNMLYINNLIDPGRQCMGWGWYLANDMQFYVVSPLLLIPFYYSRVWGSICCMFFILVNFVSSAVVTSHYNLSASLVFDIGNPAGYDMLYVKPYCRIGPYAVGMFTGYLLYKTNGKIRMHKLVNLLGWALATVIALLVLYGLWNSSGGGNPTLNRAATMIYNATSRTAWGVVVCWVVFACVTGYGGPVNTFLSWRAFIPLSRLSYCCYLVHLLILNVYNGSAKSQLFYTDIEMSYRFVGTTVISYAAALLVSLAFEAPMMGLEKAVLGRDKRS